MNSLIKSIILVTNIVFVACSQGAITTGNIVVEPEAVDMSIGESGILSDMDLIQLETNDSVLIGNIDKVIATSDRLFIADFENLSVYIFDLDGKYINKISNQGRGADEYIYLFDICYNKDNNTINLLSRNTSKILTYTKDGEIINVTPLPVEAIEVEYHDGCYYATTGFYSQEACTNNNLVIMDTAFNVLDAMFAIDGIRSEHSSYDNLYVYNREIHYVDNWLFRVYKTNSVDVCYCFDFGAVQRPKHLDGTDVYKKALIEDRSVAEYITSVDKVQECSNYILATYTYGGRSCMVVADKRTNKTSSYSLGLVEKFYALPFGKIVDMSQDQIVTYIPASRVLNIYRGFNEYNDFREDFPNQIKRLQEKFSNISEDDNPFIAVYKI